jgi:hypothetical protein
LTEAGRGFFFSFSPANQSACAAEESLFSFSLFSSPPKILHRAGSLTLSIQERGPCNVESSKLRTHVRLDLANEDLLAGALRTAWKLRLDKNAKTAKNTSAK